MRPRQLFLRVTTNIAVCLGLFVVTVAAIERVPHGELAIYAGGLLVAAFARTCRHRGWFYVGLLTYDIVYTLPLVAYYILGWRDM